VDNVLLQTSPTKLAGLEIAAFYRITTVRFDAHEGSCNSFKHRSTLLQEFKNEKSLFITRSRITTLKK
jgi:hypothetical protein